MTHSNASITLSRLISLHPIGSKGEEIQAMFIEVIQKYGKVDVLVNNDGIAHDGLMVRMKLEQWQLVQV